MALWLLLGPARPPEVMSIPRWGRPPPLVCLVAHPVQIAPPAQIVPSSTATHAGGLSSLSHRRDSASAGPHGRHRPAPVDWAAGSGGGFAQPLYSVYSEASYDVIWSEYAYQSNVSWWFYQDFGKAGGYKTAGSMYVTIPRSRRKAGSRPCVCWEPAWFIQPGVPLSHPSRPHAARGTHTLQMQTPTAATRVLTALRRPTYRPAGTRRSLWR
jgi:hypothetical protein